MKNADRLAKKLLVLGAALLLVLSLAGCGGDIRGAQVTSWESELYTQKEVQSAIDTAKRYFKNHFSGCTLIEITYAGDETTEKSKDFARRNGADDVIVLTSSFDVDASGGNGSFDPNSTYKNFQWILIRKHGGSWKHIDHGY